MTNNETKMHTNPDGTTVTVPASATIGEWATISEGDRAFFGIQEGS